MPCQVPVASFPFDIGILTLAPIKEDLICACNVVPLATYPRVINPRLVYRHIIAPLCIVPVESFSSCLIRPVSYNPENGSAAIP